MKTRKMVTMVKPPTIAPPRAAQTSAANKDERSTAEIYGGVEKAAGKGTPKPLASSSYCKERKGTETEDWIDELINDNKPNFSNYTVNNASSQTISSCLTIAGKGKLSMENEETMR
jgi:hypothetical protein